jgi:hypothetical protein
MKSGTRVIIGDEEVQLQWGDRKFSKMIRLSAVNNIPIMQSARRLWNVFERSLWSDSTVFEYRIGWDVSVGVFDCVF